jgi:hypothetical protein
MRKEQSEWTEEERQFATLLQREPARWTPDCPEPEDLIGLIKQADSYPGAARMRAHIADCACCAREFGENWEAFQAAESAPKPPVAASAVPAPPAKALAPSAAASGRTVTEKREWWRLSAPALGMAAGVAAAALLYGAVILPRQRQLQETQTQMRQQNSAAQIAWDRQQQTDAERLAQAQAETAYLRQRVRDLENRPVQVAPSNSAFIAQTQQKGLHIPPLMTVDTTETQGDADASPARIHLLSPVGSILRETRPTFRWRPLDGATYTLSIEDAGSHIMDQNVSGTAWRAENRFRPGDYFWWVLAYREDRVVGASPNAVFRILDAKKATELESAKREFVLVYGIRAAQAGLLVEAEQTFRSIPGTDPNYPAARRFLREIQDWRRRQRAP